ncbi:MAG TPA: hypothetical protein VJJ26_02035 [Candidatus Babeliales bacterium]|nr:hypothetical protein [Candidatus Babeliales bacterium]
MKYKIHLTVAIVATTQLLFALDNPHFYRATNMFLEPRLEHDYLTTFNATLGGGSSTKGRSAHNTIVPLFDIYGTQSFQDLNVNTLFQDPNNQYNQLLAQLNMLPVRTNFATLSIDGHFKIIESNLSCAQNLSKGLFLFFHLPVRRLQIKDITFTDLSPDDDIVPNKNTPVWQQVLQELRPLLANYGINVYPTTSAGVGDLTSWLGWTHNYQETNTLDFIDFTLMAGFLAPTGKQRNENKLFSLPTGYNGHWGFPLCTTASIGFYEWVTIGGYLNTLFFINKSRAMRIKTDCEQSGIIKLACARVSDHRGPLINTGFYCKADHVGHGVSATAAYSFASQQKSHLTPSNPVLFDRNTMNSDPMLAGWNMHTLNFLLEYDFAKEDSTVGNRIGLFYNLQVAGARVFNTNVVGGTYGIDITWSL